MHGFGERSFARRHRRGEKRAPLREAWKGSRLRAWSNTQNHCKVLRFRTRNSYHLPRIITTRTPFSPDRMRKRCKGCHCAQATERHRAQTTESRQTPPPPRTPQNVADSLKKRGGWAGGCYLWAPQPPAPLALFTSSWPNEAARTRIKPTTDARPAPCGGGGLPLPAAAAAAP